jgi:phenylpropionate dioxygenase-like ring-hydroxylating dioxygenase large terminal subunit
MDGSFGPRDGGAIRDDFIPAENYLSPELVKLENARMWPKVWQMACRIEEIPKVGDFVTYDIADESIIVVRISPGRFGSSKRSV